MREKPEKGGVCQRSSLYYAAPPHRKARQFQTVSVSMTISINFTVFQRYIIRINPISGLKIRPKKQHGNGELRKN
jgi:hypothetical protein